MEPEFQAWPKIPRWDNESYVITEKIDGTNGCIIITEDGDIFAQSRTRILDETSEGDNYGFCKWVRGNSSSLLTLGVGYHYGEWCESIRDYQLVGYGEMVITLDFDSGISGSSPDSPANYL